MEEVDHRRCSVSCSFSFHHSSGTCRYSQGPSGLREWVPFADRSRATFIPAVKALFRRVVPPPSSTDDSRQASNDTEYAFRRSKSLLFRIRASVLGRGGLLAGLTFLRLCRAVRVPERGRATGGEDAVAEGEEGAWERWRGGVMRLTRRTWGRWRGGGGGFCCGVDRMRGEMRGGVVGKRKQRDAEIRRRKDTCRGIGARWLLPFGRWSGIITRLLTFGIECGSISGRVLLRLRAPIDFQAAVSPV